MPRVLAKHTTVGGITYPPGPVDDEVAKQITATTVWADDDVPGDVTAETVKASPKRSAK